MTAAADKRPRHLYKMYLMRWGETGGLVLAVWASNSVVCPRVPASAVELVTAPNLHLIFRDSGTAGTADHSCIQCSERTGIRNAPAADDWFIAA